MPTEAPVSIREAIRNGVSTPSPEPTPTETPSSKPLGGEAQPDGIGAYDPKLVEDLQADLSTLSLEQRKVIEPLVAKFRKPYDKAFHRAMAEVAELKRALEAENTPPPVQQAQAAAKTIRGLHRRLEHATDPAVKAAIQEGIQDIEETIEDVLDRMLGSKLKPLTERVEGMESTAVSSRMAEASAELDELEDVHGLPASLVEKYRAEVLRAAAKYPTVSLKEIFVKVVPWADLQPVILKLSHPAPADKSTPKEEDAAQTPPEKERVNKKPASVSGVPESSAIAKFADRDGQLTKRGLVGLIKAGLTGR